MTRSFATLLLLLALVFPVLGQQTALTDEQIRTAAAEVPRLVELLELQPGMTVADVGAGFGAWSMRFAQYLGPNGRVYATDLGAAQLASMRASMAREKLTNVTVIEGGVDATNLPPACCDGILVRDAYHHFTDPAAMIRSLAASLKPGGRLALIDFPPRPNSSVPAGVPADRGGHGVPIAVVEREVGGVLTHVRTIPDWSTGGNQLYLVLFRKP
jgi:precorrin-6B methylase 2